MAPRFLRAMNLSSLFTRLAGERRWGMAGGPDVCAGSASDRHLSAAT